MIKKYLIMERIEPPKVPAFLLKAGHIVDTPATLQEIGIFSSLFIDLNASNSSSLI
jgi:hypothetical protein